MGVYHKLSNVQRNIAINPTEVVTDKASLPLELYSVVVIFMPSSGYETGELLGTTSEMCGGVPFCSRYLYSASFPFLPGRLENGK